MDTTGRVVEFVVGNRFERLPQAAIAAAKGAILDSIGVGVAGSREEAGRIAADLAQAEASTPEAGLFGRTVRVASSAAAMANGTATHALDFDASFSVGGQPMAGLTPAVLALAEPLGASGRQLIEAYVTGYEVAAKLAWCMTSHASDGTWHSTATAGSFGAAAAASHLLGLDAAQTRMALGITASMASGIVANFGTMSKPLHAGLAARNGVLAARLAQRGFSGTPASIEEQGGFLGAFGQGMAPNLKPLETLGEVFEVERGVRYKAYPCGGLTHSAIDAMLALRAEHQLTPDDVARIDVAVTRFTADRIVYRIPETELQGKFSMAYLLARALVDGGVGLNSFSEEAIREPAVLAVAERVEMRVDASLEGDGARSRPCVVSITLRDGRTLTRRVDYPRGSLESPMSVEELHAKFRACTVRVLGERPAAEVMEKLAGLETVEDVRSVTALLDGGA